MHALILEYNIHLVVGNRGMYNGVNTVYANENIFLDAFMLQLHTSIMSYQYS